MKHFCFDIISNSSNFVFRHACFTTDLKLCKHDFFYATDSVVDIFRINIDGGICSSMDTTWLLTFIGKVIDLSVHAMSVP
jgi:hypothetical protein